MRVCFRGPKIDKRFAVGFFQNQLKMKLTQSCNTALCFESKEEEQAGECASLKTSMGVSVSFVIIIIHVTRTRRKEARKSVEKTCSTVFVFVSVSLSLSLSLSLCLSLAPCNYCVIVSQSFFDVTDCFHVRFVFIGDLKQLLTSNLIP